MQRSKSLKLRQEAGNPLLLQLRPHGVVVVVAVRHPNQRHAEIHRHAEQHINFRLLFIGRAQQLLIDPTAQVPQDGIRLSQLQAVVEQVGEIRKVEADVVLHVVPHTLVKVHAAVALLVHNRLNFNVPIGTERANGLDQAPDLPVSKLHRLRRRPRSFGRLVRHAPVREKSHHRRDCGAGYARHLALWLRELRLTAASAPLSTGFAPREPPEAHGRSAHRKST
mmetsp:Transcript_17175/g.65561  ORF Transcript_17175/g.65561 Transcript_17175/m.65561 type:complete len:223 (+) Transcript_17175:359-1027(+)